MKKVINWYLGLNIFCKLIPFLLFYSALSLLFGKEKLIQDEERYVLFAENLLKGFFSPPLPNIDLWNGPGYPALLASFMFFKVPVAGLRLINGVLLYLSLIFTYRTISMYSSEKTALSYTVILGLYFPIFQYPPLLYSESLAWFLISLIILSAVKTYRQKDIEWKYVLLSALSLAYLAMTKIIFGYVIFAMLFASILMFIIPKFQPLAKKNTLVFAVSFVFCLPWLFYTYSITGKPFYWANSGNMSLYTMSTPFENEVGDWYTITDLQLNPNHKGFIDSVIKLTPLQRDDAFKAQAIKNIRNHPKKYFFNWIYNTNRLLFFPSASAPKTIFAYHAFIPNMFVFVFIVITLLIGGFYYKRIPPELLVLLLFILIYLFGSTLLSTYRRMFYITMPFWIVYFSYIFNSIVSIKIRKN